MEQLRRVLKGQIVKEEKAEIDEAEDRVLAEGRKVQKAVEKQEAMEWNSDDAQEQATD